MIDKIKQRRIELALDALDELPVHEALEVISLYASKELSMFSSVDAMLKGVEACQADLAEEMEWEGYDEDKARAYRAMQMGSGA